jgi:hypothetical protein
MIRKIASEAKKSSLEREVITAVTILYALICAAMLATHYLQPGDQETVTSSTSPSHVEFSTSGAGAGIGQPLTLGAAYDRLARDGYDQPRDMRVIGLVIEGAAIRDGKAVRFSIDMRTGVITSLAIAQ